MFNVYLDQNHWIGLAQAEHRSDAPQELRDALAMVEASVDLGQAAYPLGVIHYMETRSTANERRRRELASTMSRISRGKTACQVHEVIPAELDAALRKRFGRPLEPRSFKLFGEGADQALGNPGFREAARQYRPPDKPELTPARRHLFMELTEFSILAGNPGDPPIDPKANPWKTGAAAYIEREKKLVEWFRDNKIDKHDREIWLAMHTLQDVAEMMVEAINRAGISSEEFEGLGPEGMLDFLSDLPTRHIEHQIRCAHHDNPQQPWEVNDLGDLGALCIGIGYFDVIVTEKRWVHLARHRKLDVRYNTQVFDSVVGFADFLATRQLL